MGFFEILTPMVSGLGGGLLRLAPEILKHFDRKHERAHELALGDQQQSLIRLQSTTRMGEIHANADAQSAITAMEGLREATKAQMQLTGSKVVDAMNFLVRPLWTYMVLLTWFSVKVADVVFAIHQGMPWLTIRGFVWGVDDSSMVAALMTFWFLDRTIRKQRS